LDWDSGIDWRSIFALKESDVCSIHAYSMSDETITIPSVSSYCRELGKPWITEEFGWERSIGDGERARAFQRMYDLQRSHGAAGAGFWNLGGQIQSPTFDVNSSSPLTLEVVRNQSVNS
jgi:hypothetical protein